MKALLVALVALGTVVAASASAQASHRQWSSRVHVYAAGHYQRHQVQNNNTNPDFQLGGADR
jgi:hypothetical protein